MVIKKKAFGRKMNFLLPKEQIVKESDTTMMPMVVEAHSIKKQHCKLKKLNGISTQTTEGNF
jgi:hypothetical protein